VTVEDSRFERNGTDLQVGEVGRFVLRNSALSGASAVRSGAVENEVRGNRFSAAVAEGGVVLLAFADSKHTSVAGNVLVADGPAEAIFVQSSNARGDAQELIVERNTFVSRAGAGATFIETLGDVAPSLRAGHNLFWGQGTVPDGLAADNYIGEDLTFAGDTDFRVSNGVGEQYGAMQTHDSGFPLAGDAQSQDASRVQEEQQSAKSAVRSTISGVRLQTVKLQTTSVGGAAFLFSNNVVLNTAAPSNMPVSITSSNPAVVSVLNPAVTVAAGSTSAKFILRTTATAGSKPVTITANGNGTTAAAVITVGSVALSSMTVESSTLGSGVSTLQNRVYLSGPSPAGGAVVALRSSNSAVVVPSSVTVASAVNNTAFTITARTVTAPLSATIYATYNGKTVSCPITVAPSALKSGTAIPTVVPGGNQALLKFVLTGPAPAGGMVVRLTSSNPAVISIPTTATIPAGFTYVAVPCRTFAVSSTRTVNVTASHDGVSRSATVTVVPR
jgi:hypothetical protein